MLSGSRLACGMGLRLAIFLAFGGSPFATAASRLMLGDNNPTARLFRCSAVRRSRPPIDGLRLAAAIRRLVLRAVQRLAVRGNSLAARA